MQLFESQVQGRACHVPKRRKVCWSWWPIYLWADCHWEPRRLTHQLASSCLTSVGKLPGVQVKPEKRAFYFKDVWCSCNVSVPYFFMTVNQPMTAFGHLRWGTPWAINWEWGTVFPCIPLHCNHCHSPVGFATELFTMPVTDVALLTVTNVSVMCLCMCYTVGLWGVPQIPGIARLSAKRRQKVYRSEVCVKCKYFFWLVPSLVLFDWLWLK